MDTATRFYMNPKVVHEVFEDEIVVINLDNGNYYTLSQVSADIWTFLEKGASVAETLQGIQARYTGSPGAIETDVTAFIGQLVEEDLIHPGAPTATVTDLALSVGDDRPTFQTPSLQKYMDMQALLVLDPIHEVDEMGWPTTKP